MSEKTDFYTDIKRSEFRFIDEVGAKPFLLFKYYLTYKTAPKINPSLQTIADDMGLEKNAVCNLRSRLIQAGWIRLENDTVTILKSFTKNESPVKKRSQKMNKRSQNVNDSFTKNESHIRKSISNKNKQEKNIANAISDKPKKTRQTKNEKLAKDPRSQHVAIQIIRGLMKRYPDQVLWDKIINRFGEHFNKDKLTDCRVAWVERGYNPNATTWLNWYFDGIPERNGEQNGTPKTYQNGNRTNGNKPAGGRTDAETLALLGIAPEI